MLDGRFLLTLAVVLFAQLNRSSCFWFADTSLFQPTQDPISQALPLEVATQAIKSVAVQPAQVDNQKQQVSFRGSHLRSRNEAGRHGGQRNSAASSLRMCPREA